MTKPSTYCPELELLPLKRRLLLLGLFAFSSGREVICLRSFISSSFFAPHDEEIQKEVSVVQKEVSVVEKHQISPLIINRIKWVIEELKEVLNILIHSKDKEYFNLNWRSRYNMEENVLDSAINRVRLSPYSVKLIKECIKGTPIKGLSIEPKRKVKKKRGEKSIYNDTYYRHYNQAINELLYLVYGVKTSLSSRDRSDLFLLNLVLLAGGDLAEFFAERVPNLSAGQAQEIIKEWMLRQYKLWEFLRTMQWAKSG